MSNKRINFIHDILENKGIKNDKNIVKIIVDYLKPDENMIELKQHNLKQIVNNEDIFSVNITSKCVEKGIKIMTLFKLRNINNVDYWQELRHIIYKCEETQDFTNRINDLEKLILKYVNQPTKHLVLSQLLDIDIRINRLKRLGIQSDYKLI